MANKNRSLRPLVILPFINRAFNQVRFGLAAAALGAAEGALRLGVHFVTPPLNTPMGRATLWMFKHATLHDRGASLRVIRDFWNNSGLNSKTIDDSVWRRLLGDTLEIQPGDADILARMRERARKSAVRNDMRF